ncbi:hypothetical protein IAS59_003436 [Cryptococcus gattii]
MKYHGHIKLRNDILASTQVVYIGKVQRLLTLFLTRLYLNRSLLTVSRALPKKLSPQKIRLNNSFPKAYGSEFKMLEVPIKAAPDELKGFFTLEGNLGLNHPPTT